MIRRLYALATLAAVMSAAGCATSPCSTGWSFQMGKPPTIAGQTVLGPSLTTFAGQGIATGPLSGHVMIAPQAAVQVEDSTMLPAPQLSRSFAKSAAVPSCSLDDVCNMLRSMQQQLSKLSAQRMPQGEQE